MVDLKFVNQLKDESIMTAEEMALFPKNVIDELYDTKIEILKGWPELDELIFGIATCGYHFYSTDDIRFEKVVQVYEHNYSESFDAFFGLLKRKGVYSKELERTIRENFTEEDLFLIYNQSGMDHELLGHIGSKLNGLAGDERDACVIEYQVAGYRGKRDRRWAIAAEVTPLFQEKHRKIPLNEYRTTKF